VVVWLRWTLPRIRIDQMMSLCWKYLVPAAFACFVFTLFWELAAGSLPKLELASGVLLTVAALVVLALFAKRVRDNIHAVHGDKLDLSNW
jgi:NADH-quinone oxidoreductase subunit H